MNSWIFSFPKPISLYFVRIAFMYSLIHPLSFTHELLDFLLPQTHLLVLRTNRVHVFFNPSLEVRPTANLSFCQLKGVDDVVDHLGGVHRSIGISTTKCITAPDI